MNQPRGRRPAPDVDDLRSTPPGAGGLSLDEAARRLTFYGPNEIPEEPRTPVWRRVLQQLRDPLILVLLVAAALTIATGDLTDATVILLVIAVNTAVGVVQEVRAEQAVLALSAMSAPAARVVRDGEERSIPAAEVVPGDLVLVGVALGLQAAGVYLPPLRELLGTEPLPLTDLAIAAALSGLGHVVMRVQARLRPERPPGAAVPSRIREH
ncbi:cation-transporting P-type ATPase [Streptomyces sp. NBC_00259]|uniref:cation-transporting P-type ATPase n=1 Tax=Streptomyces sp. NBC_00259 TaxID=2903643 RepID=UPI002E2C9AF0|nr:cation-transporting P-type ATPase [Streptomyces sp. NBC_00259]